MTCIKYIVFAVNFLFFVMGIAAVALGIYALVDKNDMEALTKIDSDGKLAEFNGVGLLQSGAIVLIVGGACLLLLGFLGCCGAVKEVRCLLATYAAIVIVIIIIQLTAAGLAIAFKGRIEDYLKEGLKKGLVLNYDGTRNSTNAFSRAFDFAQVYFECCGVDGASDFANATKWKDNYPTDTVPRTCCELRNRDAFFDDNIIELKIQTCPTTAAGTGNPNTSTPCYSKIEDWIKTRAAIIIGIAFGIIFIEILAVVFACCLYRSIES